MHTIRLKLRIKSTFQANISMIRLYADNIYTSIQISFAYKSVTKFVEFWLNCASKFIALRFFNLKSK